MGANENTVNYVRSQT